MITRAIVLAHRLVLEGGSELSPANLALIRQTLATLEQIGVRRVCVVDGENAEELRGRLALHQLPGLEVDVLANRCWRRNSGSAVLVAADFLAESAGACLVLRGDRPLDRDSLLELATAQLGQYRAAMTLATAPDSAELHCEVKARVHKSGVNEVANLGLDLVDYDAVYTGHALVRPSIVKELSRYANPTLEDGLAHWAERGLVRAVRGRASWSWGAAPARVDDNVAALLDAKQHPRYTLLNPGPVNTTARVKAAMVHHDVCHRDSNFSELMVSLTGKLRRIFRGSADHTVCLITGSGTAAMETALASAVPRDRKVLIVDNGAFGERLYEIARLHEMEVVHLRYAWGDQVNPADVERAFMEHDIAVVAMSHHETSVGLLNPISEIGEMCRRYDSLFVVDAVSSLGAEDLDVVRDNIDICYSSANKCLHAISGAGFLCVAPRVWPKIDTIRPRSYYLDLKRYRRYMDDVAQTPFTPAVSAYFALDAACSEFLADGHEGRWAMYRARNRRLRKGLSDLGLAPFTRTGNESHSVVTCCVPNGLTFEQLYTGLKQRGVIVYACKDVLADKFLQVANMGELELEHIDRFLELVRDVIAECRARNGRVAAPARAVASAS
jgi:2-aminoethylphosphonate-pyruvate transaminase